LAYAGWLNRHLSDERYETAVTQKASRDASQNLPEILQNNKAVNATLSNSSISYTLVLIMSRPLLTNQFEYDGRRDKSKR